MILVALVVALATSAGVASERRSARAEALGRGALWLMLYVLVPFIAFVNFAHLHLTTSSGAGLALAYLALGVTGVAAWVVARRLLRLSRPETGALICAAILVNTGYLGLPMTVTLLGSTHLTTAVAYDQVISGPMLFIVGFGVGAVFGTGGGEGRAARVRAFLQRNPPLLAVVAGLIAPASAAPHVLVQASHVVVVALLPIGFYVVGVSLSAARVSARLLEPPDRRVIAAVALRLLVAPLLLLAISATVLRLPTPYVLEAAMPTAVNSLVVGHAYELDQQLIASAIVWSTAAVLLLGLTISIV